MYVQPEDFELNALPKEPHIGKHNIVGSSWSGLFRRKDVKSLKKEVISSAPEVDFLLKIIYIYVQHKRFPVLLFSISLNRIVLAWKLKKKQTFPIFLTALSPHTSKMEITCIEHSKSQPTKHYITDFLNSSNCKRSYIWYSTVFKNIKKGLSA